MMKMAECSFLLLLPLLMLLISITHCLHDNLEEDYDTEEHTDHDHLASHRPDVPDISTSAPHLDKDGHHDDAFDHESVIGSKSEAEEFKELSPEESKRRLGILVDKIDTNLDGFVDGGELTNWIVNSYKKLDIENSKHNLEDHDENNDKKVTWEEYIHKSYGYNEKELQEFFNGTDESSHGFAQTIKEERFKFHLADQNKDGALTLDEYPSFIHPQNYPQMGPYEAMRTMAHFDKNKDGFVDLNEFIGDGKIDPEQMDGEKEQFAQLDKDKNGKLDKFEIIPWSMTGFNSTAHTEAEHLIKETDENRDGKLSKMEILAQSDLWVGSHATDYGKHLEDLDKKSEL